MSEARCDAESEKELFTIGEAVESLRARFPEVSHSSLRFLEREGLLQSERTPGGHRLYSRSTIERIVLIKEWQQRSQSLEAIRKRLAEWDELVAPGELSEQFLQLALEHQIERAQQIILRADEAGLSLESTFYDVLRPALNQVGDLWEAGLVHVHQEKEISELCRELVTELSLRHELAGSNSSLFLAACVEGERHEIGLRMLCGLLRQQGYRVRYLGVDVATRFLVDAARANRPNAVLLSATLATNFFSCRDAIEALNDIASPTQPPIVVGGHIAFMRGPDLESWGAIPIVDDRDIVTQVAGLLR